MENEKLMETSKSLKQKIKVDSSYEELKELFNNIDQEMRFYLIADILNYLEGKMTEALQLKNKSLKKIDSDLVEAMRSYAKQIKKLQKKIREVRDDLLIEALPINQKVNLSVKPYLRRELSAYYNCLMADYKINSKVEESFNKYSFDMYVYDKLNLLKDIRGEYDLEKSRLKEKKTNILEQLCKEIRINTGKKVSTHQKDEIKRYLHDKKYHTYEEALVQNKISKNKVKAILESLDQLITLQQEVILKEEKTEKRKARKDTYKDDYTTILGIGVSKKNT